MPKEESLTDTILAHKRELELRFCSAALRYTPTVIRDQGWLRPELFNDVVMRDFWAAVLEGKDSTAVAIELKALRKLTNAFESCYIGLSQVESYARAIADDAYKLDIAAGIEDVAKILADATADEVKDAVADISQMELAQTAHGTSSTDTALDFVDSLDNAPDVIKTKLGKIDNTFGGWSRKSLNILAARPSMGKTALALQMARSAIDHKHKVLYFSLEMSSRQLWSRMVMGEANLDHRIYKARTYTPEQRELMIAANNRMIDAYGERLIIDDRSTVTSSDIWAGAIAYKPDLLIVDHLALLADEGENQNYRIGKITKTGKAIAKEFNCAALYLCQLSRGVEARTDKIPTMPDLRDSGEIEQNADVVMFIHRPDYYEQKAVTISPTQLVLAKDREGARNVSYELQYHLIKQAFYETKYEAEK